jgi:hypothetical protein
MAEILLVLTLVFSVGNGPQQSHHAPGFAGGGKVVIQS